MLGLVGSDGVDVIAVVPASEVEPGFRFACVPPLSLRGLLFGRRLRPGAGEESEGEEPEVSADGTPVVEEDGTGPGEEAGDGSGSGISASGSASGFMRSGDGIH
jgi:hypothetical protein